MRPTKQNLVSPKVVSGPWEVAVVRGSTALVAV
jgi:hypothetical protein